MFFLFVIGTAGSGKSRLTAAFSNWLRLKKQEVISVNLDPGVLSLPYQPNVDVREYISLNRIMENYSLGPNGALILAADLIATEVETIRADIEDYNADYVIIDTPGQMELFAFRVSGPYIVTELTTDPKALLYLFDSTFSINPLNYVSNLFLASAVHTRLAIPMLHVLSKTDLVPEDKLEAILDWGERPISLEDAIEETLSGTSRIMSSRLMHLIANLDFLFSLIPVSSTNETGFINLHATLMRIFTGGEEII